MIFRFDSVTWITSLIATCIAVGVAIAIPAGYFVISYQYMIGSMDTQAKLAAGTTAGLVMANPRTWQFEEVRLQELLQRHHDRAIPELRSVIDRQGKIIAQMTEPVPNPIVMRRSDIYDAGEIVGHVEISRSLRPLLFQTALTCALSSLLGSCIFLVLRTIPLKAFRAEQLRAQKLEIQNRQLQKAESLACMAGAIAHHFNNKFTAVIGNIDLAISDLPPRSDTARILTEAMKASLKAVKVSNLMLTYLGQTPSKHEPLDLSAVSTEFLSLLRAGIPRNVTLQTALPSPGPPVLGDMNQMHQILTTLVTNAWESIEDYHGTITVAIETVFPADIAASQHLFPVGWEPKDIPYACMKVTDTGCGIADRDVEKIFDPFFTTKFPGRGLGLPAVLGIVRAHDGAVSVESAPGAGSVFRVFLPITTEKIPLQQKNQ